MRAGTPTANRKPKAQAEPEFALLDRYRKIEQVGEGTFGVVYKAVDQVTGEIVALKKTKLDPAGSEATPDSGKKKEKEENEGVPATAIREISLLRELAHPNVVKLKDVMMANSTIYLVFEYLNCDLKHYLDGCIKQNKKLSPIHVKSFVYQMLQGTSYCHAMRVIHRDLKPANLLLDEKGTLKLADFGLARTFGVPLRTFTHEVVTLWYRAPEILLGTKLYSLGVDMWAIGCIFAEMVLQGPLFNKYTELGMLFQIFQTLGTPTEEMWPGVSQLQDFKQTFPKWPAKSFNTIFPNLDPAGVDLVSLMLQYDPNKRISSKAAMQHVWFDELKALQPKFRSQPPSK